AITYNNAGGFTAAVTLENLNFGDFVDFALDPTGPDGSTQDGCDGSTFDVQIVQDASAGLVWNSTALKPRTAAETVRIDLIDLTRFRDRLVPGTNLLAL